MKSTYVTRLDGLTFKFDRLARLEGTKLAASWASYEARRGQQEATGVPSSTTDKTRDHQPSEREKNDARSELHDETEEKQAEVQADHRQDDVDDEKGERDERPVLRETREYLRVGLGQGTHHVRSDVSELGAEAIESDERSRGGRRCGGGVAGAQ